MQSAFRHAFLLALGVVASLTACDASINPSLEHKACSAEGECLPGYVCSIDQVCVKESPSRNDPQAEDDAAVIVPGPGDVPIRTASPSCDGGVTCDSACVDTATNTDHCGACGLRCTGTEHGSASCKSGTCELACDEGYDRCGDGCYRLTNDAAHCGSCTISCASAPNAEAACSDRKCRLDCRAGFQDCGGKCVRLDSDALNCGACGKACANDEQCAAGACVRTCPSGSVECARSCVDTKSDPQHCGACGHACAAPAGSIPTCQNGNCGSQCMEGRTACANSCVDTKTNSAHCGMCGKVCPTTPPRSHAACVSGTCGMRCDDGYTACEDECIGTALADAARDSNTPCATLAALQDRMMCANAGLNDTFCSGECVNIATDTRHCGRCDRACSGRCILGNCLGF